MIFFIRIQKNTGFKTLIEKFLFEVDLAYNHMQPVLN